ncbi:hypothetical protein COL922a_007380 [Colletotrichum nupharicola]|nr:hypothetical protein COL922a_007380 [Colletotrichum nupharicola]
MNGCSMASQGASIIPDRPLKWTKIRNTRSHAREPQQSDSSPKSTQPPTQSVEVISREISSGKDSASQGIVPNLVIPGESTPEPVVSEMVSPQLGPCKACDEQPCGHLRHFSVQLDEEDVEMLDATDEVNIAMNNCIQANRLYDTILMAEKPELAKKMAKKAVDIAGWGSICVTEQKAAKWMGDARCDVLKNAQDAEREFNTVIERSFQ